MAEILVTGGAGYIGSTICSALADRGDVPVILDSLVAGNRHFVRNYPFYHADIADSGILSLIKKDFPQLKAVIHCAARTVVSESVENPYLYYRENVSKTLEFIRACEEARIPHVIFSSSASVYGETTSLSVKENQACNPASPYAHSKLMCEKIIESFCLAGKLTGISLRYFNPIGADPHLRTGPYVKDPTHLLGQLMTASKNHSKKFSIFGTDWPTRDGTCIRDFIHVWDLAAAHLAALDLIQHNEATHSYNVINLGTGKGTTVAEFVAAFQLAVAKPIEIHHAPRRLGDAAGAYASGAKAESLLGWTPKRSLLDGIKDALLWEDSWSSSKEPSTFSCLSSNP